MLKRKRNQLRQLGANSTLESEHKKGRKRHDEDDDGDKGISLEGSMPGGTHEATFEFSDLKGKHIEGLTVLMKTLVPNPTRAYEVASACVEEGLD